MSLRPFLPIALICLSAALARSQDTYPGTYLDHIKSVQFHQSGLELTEPVLALGRPGTVTLMFDDMNGEAANYWYELEQVNADWSPGQLNEFEWLEGFNNNRIEQIEYSFSPRATYTHYTLHIPNEQVRIKKSGNYLLKVYDDDRNLAIVRRLLVTEPMVTLRPMTRQAALASKARTHQEIDFVVDLKELEVRNPRQEIRATVVQNGYWQGAVTGIDPFMIRDRILDFDYQDRIVFPGGKEWRFFDTRSLLTRSARIADLRQTRYVTEIDLLPDQTRAYGAYLFDHDSNGKFVIRNNDLGQQQHLSADYTTVRFTYQKPVPYEGAELCLIGAFNDYRCDPEYRMQYSEAEKAYSLSVSLKQGFYNYAYALLPQGAALPDREETEGNWYETENDYLILVYYRPLGERYDRLIAAHQFKAWQ